MTVAARFGAKFTISTIASPAPMRSIVTSRNSRDRPQAPGRQAPPRPAPRVWLRRRGASAPPRWCGGFSRRRKRTRPARRSRRAAGAAAHQATMRDPPVRSRRRGSRFDDRRARCARRCRSARVQIRSAIRAGARAAPARPTDIGPARCAIWAATGCPGSKGRAISAAGDGASRIAAAGGLAQRILLPSGLHSHAGIALVACTEIRGSRRNSRAELGSLIGDRPPGRRRR